MGCWVVGLFFLHFWRVSRDRFFLFFLGAFWLFSVNWIYVGLMPPRLESRHLVYLVRLAAFVLIIIGIVDKNRRSR